jgi:predicted phosphoribosyltransferase
VPTVDQVFVVDPLIATGGTAVAAVNMILDWGIPRAYSSVSVGPGPLFTYKNSEKHQVLGHPCLSSRT